MAGVIAAIQTFGNRINLHPHLYFLVTEGGVDEAGVFHMIPRIDDPRLAEIFAREVLAFLVHKELLSPEWAERLLSWRHTGFSVHSRVRAKTRHEAETTSSSPLSRTGHLRLTWSIRKSGWPPRPPPNILRDSLFAPEERSG